MIKIQQTSDHTQEREYQVEINGEVAFVDPSYMSPGHKQAWRDRASFRFEMTGIWHVKVTPLATVPDHRNGALIAFKDGTDPDAGDWQEVTEVFVDSALMSLFPTERGPLADHDEYLDDKNHEIEGDGGMTILAEVQQTLVCSSGLGDGAYMVLIRTGDDGQIDGAKVDFTPSAAAMSVLYGL